MTNQEVSELVDKYFDNEGYEFPDHFEHRYDVDSSAVLYSLIREHSPQSCLSIGCWQGGSSCVIMTALQKNRKKFIYYASELMDELRFKTALHVFEKCNASPIMLNDITLNKDNLPHSLDFLFIDTDHDKKTTQWIFEEVIPRVRPGGLIAIHDWAVWEEDGKWVGKGEGRGGWEETDYIMTLHEKGELPLKKIYWNCHNPFREGQDPNHEASFWEKI